MQKFLTDKFLKDFPDQPEHMSPMSAFIFYRTYSRWLDKEGRRETFKEAIRRSVEYSMSVGYKHMMKVGYASNTELVMANMRKEAEQLFTNIFNLKQFLSGRTHWVGGADTKVAEKYPMANFNCGFLEIENWTDLSELFYLLMIGTGVGFSCPVEKAKNLGPIRTDYTLLHSEYKPVEKDERLENTKLVEMENGYAKIYVGDSKEGWADALEVFFDLLTLDKYTDVKHIKISYNSIRPKGEKLKTFGGTASGHESLLEMFTGIDKVLKGEMDPTLAPLETEDGIWHTVRPVHILDIGTLIGNNVVVGGVRRTAEIFMCEEDDFETILAKYGINGVWDEEKHLLIIEKLKALGIDTSWIEALPLNDSEARPLHHRRMSNNSIAFKKMPSKEYLELIMLLIQSEGEPGFVNLESASKRRWNVKGTNPCGEILLDSKGMCNLTTVNVMSFIKEDEGVKVLDFSGLAQAQALSARAGLRMTCVDLELKDWDKVQKRDRLIGCSLTGWQDAMAMLEYNSEQEEQLLNILWEIAKETSMTYAKYLRIPAPLLSTTVKPEGTLSQVANGVSSGLHSSYAEYFIRRVRINANDPLVEVAKELGWTIHPEVGQKKKTSTTLVIDFPVKGNVGRTRKDETLENRFDNYFRFQKHYTEHNSSNTIYVKDGEWEETINIIMENWDDFIGVSFLPYDGGTYQLAPYEEITEKEYNRLIEKTLPFDISLLAKYENVPQIEEDEHLESCESGVCPIR